MKRQQTSLKRRIENIGQSVVRPTDPPVVLWRAIEYYRKELDRVRVLKVKMKNNTNRIRKEIKGRNVITTRYHKLGIHKNDMVQLFYLADTIFSALEGMGFNPKRNAFLYAALLFDAGKRPVMTTDVFSKRMGAYLTKHDRKLTAGKLLALMSDEGYVGRMGLKDGMQRYFITEEGRKFIKVAANAVNLIITRNWKFPDLEIPLEDKEDSGQE